MFPLYSIRFGVLEILKSQPVINGLQLLTVSPTKLVNTIVIIIFFFLLNTTV